MEGSLLGIPSSPLHLQSSNLILMQPCFRLLTALVLVQSSRMKKGEVMVAMATKGPEVFCSKKAELFTCRKAIEFAADTSFYELIIEGDNCSVMKVVSALQDDHSLLGNVLGDVHHLVRNLQWVRIECTRRGGNRVAHELAQFARNISHDLFWMEDVPPIAREALYQDANFSD